VECASPDLFSTDRASRNRRDYAACPSDTANRTPAVRARADNCPARFRPPFASTATIESLKPFALAAKWEEGQC